MDTPIIEEIVEQLRTLPGDLQRRVLEFARALAVSAPRGIPGQQLLRFAGTIPSDDVQRMSEAVEEGCERIDTVVLS